MSVLKLLIVEGNTKEENSNFNKAGCVPQSENFKQHIKIFEPNCEVDVVEPNDDDSIGKIVSSLKKYNGVILTGSTLRINDNSNDVRQNIEFAKIFFKHEKKIFAACWGLQIAVTAAGGKCRVSPNGPHIGIAQDVKITNEGKKHKMYFSKPSKFTTPAFNHDEVEIPPQNSILLASDKINKFMALQFNIGKSEIWGLQYHPEIPYSYMIKLIKHRAKKLVEKKFFKNKDKVIKHLEFIKKEEIELIYDLRTLELKNWLHYIKI